MRRFLSLFLLTLLVTLVVGVVSAQDDTATAEPVTLRMMTFNVLYGGDEIDFDQVIAAIVAADADIVGLQEPMGNTHVIAEAAGYDHADERMHIISRFPLLTPPDFDGTYIFAEVSPGNVIALSNVHLTSDPYGPYLVRDGEPLENVLALESTLRLPEIGRHLAVLPNLIEAGYPVLWTGDFNSPSHYDWTQTTTDARDDIAAYPVEWNVSRTIELMGFVDTWRVAHPDPVERPGYTWTPAEPPLVYEDEVDDRIDWVLAGGNVTVLSSELLGEAGNPDIDIVVDPWGSDHRAVVSELELIPAPAPTMISTDEYRAQPGELFTIRYMTNGADLIIRAMSFGIDDAPLNAINEEFAVNGAGSVMLTPHPELRTSFLIELMTPSGAILQSLAIDLDAPQSSPGIAVSSTTDSLRLDPLYTFVVGEPIYAQIDDAPGNRLDWVGVYTAGDEDMENYWLFRYVGAKVDAVVTIGAALDSYDAFPLPPGEYVLRLMLDDDYIMLAESEPFTIE